MERAPPLLFVLLCAAAFFTAAAASASIFPPFLARDGSASAASAGQFAKKQKGKVIDKYVAKLHPPWSGGKAIGDKGASGKMILKAVMYSSTSYAIISITRVFKVDSGGKYPAASNMRSCTASGVVQAGSGGPWVNVTKAGQNKRYSFKLNQKFDRVTLAETLETIRVQMALGDYYVVGHDRNENALCGKIKKVA